MIATNATVAGLAILLCWTLFSALPISVAVIVLPINLLAFYFARDRWPSGGYVAFTVGLYFAVLVILMLAIAVFGRWPFKLLMG